MNDYPLFRLKKQTKDRTEQPALSKCLIFRSTKRPELSPLKRPSMDIPIKMHAAIIEK